MSIRDKIATHLPLLRRYARALTGSQQSGDMYVQVLVETPQKLTKRQKELLQEFEQQSSSDTQPEAAGFFSKVKEFLDGLGNRPNSA